MISILEFKGKRLIIQDIPKHVELISKHINCLADNQIEYILWGDLYDYLTEYYEIEVLDYCKFHLPV